MGVVTFFLGWEIGWQRDEKNPLLCHTGLALPGACHVIFLSLGFFCQTGVIPTLECLALDELEGPLGSAVVIGLSRGENMNGNDL